MTRKRRSSLDGQQLLFTFDAPRRPMADAGLAGLDKMLAAVVAMALREDGRTRPEIAGAMTALLGEEITVHMLNGYAAESREDFNISAHRALALIVVTDRFDLLDHVLRRIGAALLVGEEIKAAELGSIDRKIAALKAQRRQLEITTKPIARNTEKWGQH